MNTLVLKVGMTLLVGSLLYSTPASTQESRISQRPPSVRITQGPDLERAGPEFAIVRWTSDTPPGSPEHEGIVHYGTDPKNLSATAKSPIRLNPGHPHTVFRVLVDGLKSRTTYFYTVESMGSDGKSDGVKSPVKQFTTT